MKKLLCVMASAAMLLFCACSSSKPEKDLQDGTALAFPGTNWNMNMDEVIRACGFEDADDLQMLPDDYAPAFLLSDREVFGETATTLNFSFINLDALAQDSGEATSSGAEFLASVTIFYPASADMKRFVRNWIRFTGKVLLTKSLYFPCTAHWIRIRCPARN